jgi:hypothetical protein
MQPIPMDELPEVKVIETDNTRGEPPGNAELAIRADKHMSNMRKKYPSARFVPGQR